MKPGIKIRLFLLGVLVPVFFACQEFPKPINDFALARAAINAAKSVDAPKHAPAFWSQAEDSYRKARLYYRERDWDNARDEFARARVAAEKAENASRLIRQKTGEFL